MKQFLVPLLIAAGASAQTASPPVNYDEAKVAPFTLPELGLTTRGAWSETRRPELLRLFAENVFGKTPTNLGKTQFTEITTKPNALDGIATRRLVHIALPDHPRWEGLDVMLYVPNQRTGPVPCFVGLSFGGNHAVSTEPDVPLSQRWMDDLEGTFIVDFRATEKSRGTESRRWPIKRILANGFALATAYYGDIEPDCPDGSQHGLRAIASPNGTETAWHDDDWGAIAVWAFGMCCIADYLETDPAIDARRLAGIGHSRLAKAALWAGAQDERFALVVANDAGEGGASLMRRDYGQTTATITAEFPHWFAKRYESFAGRPEACPVDQHMLLALIAPRLLYVASATLDRWADPKGEFLAVRAAGPAWELFGERGVLVDEQPPPETPVGDCVGYHLRTGKHDLTEYDWLRFLEFARRHWPE